MGPVLRFSEIEGAQIARVGGKGANLGELSRTADLRVPPGFCVATDAFEPVLAAIDGPLDRLSRLGPDDRDAIRSLSGEIRAIVESVELPPELADAIAAEVDAGALYAVRSSATAEDSPTASFAGQHDSFLNVAGADVPRQIRRCQASLFSERAVTYRLRNRIDARSARMAVVVQRMVPAEAAGVLFTADPVSGNRRIASIDAVFGLGEALVSGHVNPDVYRVRDGAVISRVVAGDPPLTDSQALELVALGRRIEAHFDRPQDIEWCLADGVFWFVQSRPITTLFPIPPVTDGQNHVWLSVGHQQMMTDAMTPLGLSVWLLSAGRPMDVAGGRLFVDITRALASPAGQAGLRDMAGRSDPLIGDALRTVIERGFIPSIPDAAPAGPPPGGAPAPIPTDPAISAELVRRTEASIAAIRSDLAGKSGVELIDSILADFVELKRHLADPTSSQAIMVGMRAAWWLNDKLHAWLGEKNAADTLTLSVSGNVTSEMGLALLDVADVIRPHPAVVAFLEEIRGDDFMDRLPGLAGGQAVRDAIQAWLDRYGVRGVGEIDITRPRWIEHPSAIVPLILAHVRTFGPGEAARRFEAGRALAAKKEAEVLERLRALPDGASKATETKEMIDRVRTFAGFREYPKFGMVSRYFVYKQALMRDAARLVATGVLRAPEDLFFLSIQEIREVVATGRADVEQIDRRRQEFRADQALNPPRVLTSEGEAVTGSYRREDVPAGALVGLPVSAGTVEGRARVVHDVADARLEPGDILVTAFTDPSWTPLFVGIAGLVTEVGGLMTHGAVIAREYGLPAVVGVEHATVRIRDGQRVRVHGTDGYVELL